MNLTQPWIKLTEALTEKDYEMVRQLEKLCVEHDFASLKLELDYKLHSQSEQKMPSHLITEFMYFNRDELIGYIGVSSFGRENAPLEVNGMVHPEYRRQSIFKTLSRLVFDEWKQRNSTDILLLCDKNSDSGQAFIKTTGAQYHHTEYELHLRKDLNHDEESHHITLRKAKNADALEIARQNKIYLGMDSKLEPETEEKRGMIIYLAEKDNEVIGKVHLELSGRSGGIYGFGVLPEYRRMGYGRQILSLAVEMLKMSGANDIMLQVDSENNAAYHLYKSFGFTETYAMDYYMVNKERIWLHENS